jgi:hypothetical protein
LPRERDNWDSTAVFVTRASIANALRVGDHLAARLG